MASKKTLNVKNLEFLGAARLAELLMEISEGDAFAKRRLRLEIAGTQSVEDVAHEIRKRLNTIKRARSFIDWEKIRTFSKDLEAQRLAIIEQVGKKEPELALELLWQFMEISNFVFERSDDSNGIISNIFHEACDDIGKLAEVTKPEAKALADRVFDSLSKNSYGQYDYLIETLAPALGKKGLEHLKSCMIGLSNTPIEKPPKNERKVIGWGSGGEVYEDEIEGRQRESTVRMALLQIADAQGDVDSFIAQYDEKTRKVPQIATEIAQRLLAAERAAEALAVIDAAEHRRGWIPCEWKQIRLDVLDSLERKGEAQKFRWACFESDLDSSHLKDYLKALPDFEDFEAEEKALDYAHSFSNAHEALRFLVSWPSLERAASLVITQADKIDGNFYELLSPAADALEAKHPLAATLVRRAMIDFSLDNQRSTRYRHAARHLLECESLAASIRDFGSFETHDDYKSRLKEKHGRKSSFWKHNS